MRTSCGLTRAVLASVLLGTGVCAVAQDSGSPPQAAQPAQQPVSATAAAPSAQPAAAAAATPDATAAQPAPTKLAGEDLDNLLAPIALYPDVLIAQILPASTYPLMCVVAYLMAAGEKRPQHGRTAAVDPSVQALVKFPDILKKMNDQLDWTTMLWGRFSWRSRRT